MTSCKGLPPIPQRIAMSTRDLQEAFGLGRRSARRIARKLGRKVGNKYLVSVAVVVRWLETSVERRG